MQSLFSYSFHFNENNYSLNLYVPGCALMSYKPHLADRLMNFLSSQYEDCHTLYNCCFNHPEINPETHILTPCVACMDVYEKRGYTISFLLSDIVRSKDFPFPDYGGVTMSIQDTCYARKRPDVHETIRILLQRMNIHIIEPQATRARSKCCGQTFYGKVQTSKVEELMRKRSDEMPSEDVVVFIVS